MIKVKDTDIQKKYMVTFYYPGTFFAEDSSERVESIDLNKVECPKNCFAFEFFGTEYVDLEIHGKVKTIPLSHEKIGPKYYPEGKIYTVEELQKDFDRDILITNIQYNNNDGAILCRTGNWQPYTKGKDVVV